MTLCVVITVHTQVSSKTYVGVAVSSVALQAGVDGGTGVTVTIISIPTHTSVATHTHTGW